MTGATRSGRAAAVLERWNGFWFAPQPAVTLALVRIAFGALIIGWALSLTADLRAFFGPNGVQPQPPSIPFSWGLLSVWRSDAAAVVLWAVLLLAGVALLLGWRSRLAAVIVFVCVLSFERREPFVFNSGDGLVRIEALFLALAPSGAALSLDRRRIAGSFWDVSDRALWPLRLMQLQLSLIYLATVHDKLTGATWNDGTAASYSLRLADLRNVAVPTWLAMNPLLMNAVTWGTLLVELAVGVLVWRRRWRPWVLGAGIAMHLTILLTLKVGFFTFAIFVLYLAFTPPETAQRWVSRLRGAPHRPHAVEPEPSRPADEPEPTGEAEAGDQAQAGDQAEATGETAPALAAGKPGDGGHGGR